jgi:hypothetical protein
VEPEAPSPTRSVYHPSPIPGFGLFLASLNLEIFTPVAAATGVFFSFQEVLRVRPRIFIYFPIF